MTTYSKPTAIVLLTLWAGGAIMFGAIIAPTLFNPNVLDNRELSGLISGAILKRFFLVSYYVIGLCLLFTLLGWLAHPKGIYGIRLLFFICLFLFGINLVQDKLIRTELTRIKLELKNTTNPKQTISLNNQFNRLHKVSATLFGISTAAALLAIGWTSLRKSQNS